jgi:hypothetical protein
MSQPLSAKELDELRVYDFEGARKTDSRLAIDNGELDRRLLATIEARDRENAALAAKLANIRKLCDEDDDAKEQERLAIAPYELDPARKHHLRLINAIRVALDAKPGVE